MANPEKSVLSDLASLVAYHQSCGISGYPESEGLRQFFQDLPTPELPVSPPRVHRLQGQTTDAATSSRAPVGSVLPIAIADEVSACRACGLAAQRVTPVAGRGGDRVRLLIVGDWLAVPAEGTLPEDCQFGLEQDQMVQRMMAAINLTERDVFITNVIKCALPAGSQPEREHLRVCLAYLHRQIAALTPEVICTMGLMATRALLENPAPLSRLRGRFLPFRTSDGGTYPLLATYHPTFLLQNPEMKKTAWVDLQLLAGHLKTGRR